MAKSDIKETGVNVMLKGLFTFAKQIPGIVLSGWKRALAYRGVSTRKEYWGFLIGNNLILNVLLIMAQAALALGGIDQRLAFFPQTIFAIGTFFCCLPLLVRRYRDTGETAWWIALPVVSTVTGSALPPGSLGYNLSIILFLLSTAWILLFVSFWPSKS